MEESQYLFVRLPDTCLVVRYPFFGTEVSDYDLRFFEVIAGHVREKMVFDLVV